ncbi:putative mitochondrial methylcrotonoyl-coa carboxylase biotinylated subunitprotein-like protein [Leptomonas pyrrhocoris]|uniref:Putative mitochondrial methylcrotonoyl-coa carboxylase biotinylated subunitprotein-like protein n=1 Tax=Leptomonas pyrrhocoris TaxID=157538 RepID=A0A0M9FRM6_LEPPY|nr:putative mitochondrial methylcrotonoyl-coa carboxylase biotinylated subunitprotein-like protein [Leptomonas pyrrhocoris]XP_015653052.1 putative mitochondrial methylcrotonoyl-coa carboxylase biotinylated subunitprotein-like protein [Leptomonas pyrrhocoris]KPA74612.1 putative mitochondrial methylcrotonoyl-coa carboxylase biotinylated subunitprotein-like protein [Leptomonas pyrrhocoris]KPA74613.1 putative mitochondrial methylcrotonoyl-coa carboxylase biotinylated subunitprotein-like protein [Lep|eukprot:XP_015653051.1 putative mitochondrial methylcrotonoyl-coa carboxylase biotinylated subunitprotein-like protein [Leptomonas pyrrhocoris]
MLRRTIFAAQRKIEKLMVANRGEIACRVFRTCRQMHIRTVALFCEAEHNAKHVVEADEAVCIGPPPAINSYLRGDRVIEVAKKLNVDAIHPGYGFLSENAEFAEAVAKSGIEFIGPPASAITAMGSKSESKRIMEAAGVPVVPGYYGTNQDPHFLSQEASKVGYPVLIKAVSGGGGKGMKIVERAEDFAFMLESAKREATNFFKDDRVLLERYVKRPRHIECQIFCDKEGRGVFFFERDCSVQRRYQKVLEEAPAPYLSAETRQRIGEVALQAAKAVDYVGAGTVEFILDTTTGDFYFMEMNTRLQVEHPVTEEVCRVKGNPLDLVKLQIKTAMGRPLTFSQEDITLEGSCIEARVYAESPEKGFLPESGPLTFIGEPFQGLRGSTRTRLDTGFRQGDEVLIHYDPMLAKLIVWGRDRQEALKGLQEALDEYRVAGINTNIEFLKRCCETPEFAKGGVTTNFISEHEKELLTAPAVTPDVAAMAATACLLHRCDNWRGAFRLNGDTTATVHFSVGEKIVEVLLHTERANYHKIYYNVDGQTGSFSVGSGPATAKHRDVKGLVNDFTFLFEDGIRHTVLAVVTERDVTVIGSFGLHKIRFPPLADGFGDASAAGNASAKMISPMPGKVTKFAVGNGDMVEKGQVIMILEAMKMEHPIKALKGGRVSFFVNEGEMVGGDHPLASVSEAS